MKWLGKFLPAPSAGVVFAADFTIPSVPHEVPTTVMGMRFWPPLWVGGQGREVIGQDAVQAKPPA